MLPIALVSIGVLAANLRVRFVWVCVLLVALIAFQITQPVLHDPFIPGAHAIEGR